MSQYQPKPKYQFSFGLWTADNTSVEPFGKAVRSALSPGEMVHLLAEVGAWGGNFHDNDLVLINATPVKRDRSVAHFQQALPDTGIVAPMAIANLFDDSAFRDSARDNAFTY